MSSSNAVRTPVAERKLLGAPGQRVHAGKLTSQLLPHRFGWLDRPDSAHMPHKQPSQLPRSGREVQNNAAAAQRQ